MSKPPAQGGAELARRLIALCERDTTSGAEDAGLDALVAEGEALGATLHLDEVAPGRTNVLVACGRPRVLFTTHLDTVPPFLPPALDGARVRGRGTCDAKGQVLAQLEAMRRLLDAGLDGVGFLGVVGEETDAAGAAAAGAFAERLDAVRLVVNGEPTELAAATGQRGYLHLRLVARGVAAHSGSPELGRSALWPLLDALARLRAGGERADAELGPEVWNLGTVHGGRAANVVPDEASAEVLCRTVPGSDFLARARAACGDAVALEVLVDEAPERYPRLADLPYRPMPFGSDLPALRRLLPRADAVLLGPGSIQVAHTDREHLDLADLGRGIDALVRLARGYLAPPS